MIEATAKLEPLHFAAAEVTIKAAEVDGAKKSPPRFDVLAYTGGMIRLSNYRLPVVIDLTGLQRGNNVVANTDHVKAQRVGTVTDYQNDGSQLRLGGFANAATAARDEVVNSDTSRPSRLIFPGMLEIDLT